MDTFVRSLAGESLLALVRCDDGWCWRACDRLIVIFATGPPDRTAQELWLLMRLRRQTITGSTFPAARRDASLGARLKVGCWLWLRQRLRRTLETLWSV
jgi:hypothetical protein